MLRIAIVEDEDVFAQELQNYLERFGTEHKEKFSVLRYTDGEEITRQYTSEFDIILMDIQMEVMDGMAAAEKIRQTDSSVIIIFITNRTDYAIRGYQVDALDYVLKPINYLSFEQKIMRAMERISNRRGKKIYVNTRNGLLRLDVSRVYYIESQGHNVTYYTAIGDYTVRERIQDVEDTLVGCGFFRTNKGSLVNLRHVDSFQDGCAVINGVRLPVSRARRTDFLTALTRYLGDS